MPYKTREESDMKIVSIWGKKVRTPLIFIKQLFTKLDRGYSPIIGICGSQRIGKSFIGLWLTYLIYQITGKELDLKKVIFYEPEEAIKNLESKEKDVEWIDEPDAIDYQEWYLKAHKAIRSMINTQGYKNNLYIIISPFIAQIDKSLRIHQDFLIKVTRRGNFKVWKYEKKYDAEEMKHTTKKVFLDYCNIKMDIIPKELWKEYKEFSRKEKERIRRKRMNLDTDKKKKPEDLNTLDVIELSREH